MTNFEEEPEAANMTDWRLGLQQPDLPPQAHRFAEQLRESSDPYAVVAKLGLPVPFYIKFDSPGALLEGFEAGLAPFHAAGITNFYVGLRPTRDGLEKYRNDEVPLAIDQIAPYIADRVSPDQYNDYSLRVAEFAVGAFGAIIVINPSGFQQVDIAIGDVGPLATGRKRPEYRARTDTGDVLRYTRVKPELDGNRSVLEDRADQIRFHPILNDELRSVIAGIIKQIPRVDPQDESVRSPRLPGRYEVVLVRHADEVAGSKLVAVCVDAQPDSGNNHPYAIPEEPLWWGDGSRAN